MTEVAGSLGGEGAGYGEHKIKFALEAVIERFVKDHHAEGRGAGRLVVPFTYDGVLRSGEAILLR